MDQEVDGTVKNESKSTKSPVISHFFVMSLIAFLDILIEDPQSFIL
jgi:hypothetical protein